MKKLFPLFIGIAILLNACSGGELQTVSLNLEKGETYSYYIIAKVDINQNLSGMKMHQFVEVSSKVNYTVNDIEDGVYTFEVRYEKTKMYMDMGTGTPVSFDSENPDPTNPISLILHKLKDDVFYVKVSEYGEIMDFIGLDELNEKIVDEVAPDDFLVKAQVKSFMAQSYSKETLTVAFEPMFNFYPALDVREGDSWEKKNIGENHLGKLEPFTYTLVDVLDDSYLIEGEGEIVQKDNPTPVSISGYDITYRMDGDVTSSFELDAETGWVIKGEVIETMNGDNEINVPALSDQPMISTMEYVSTTLFSKEAFDN